ncbi:extracellular solute-binding protein [Xylanibacillus composti]|uniref:Extracellular solute-binding protein n=1 Tax=Xylanibacillus composti TaxID=1572762 RepID=A0A8J4M0I3_9BACL|nr:extracellular solute-binding protein [Xylanibacillus composti]MDT9725782.1 extracellular solute-binding protein [Xylanibacillus composti]GIQ67504.1 hypothetical protein XYCOK13_03280 [Xylanibacillus composti]
MNNRRVAMLICCFCLLLAACRSGTAELRTDAGETNLVSVGRFHSSDKELTLWTYYDPSSLLKEFKKMHPDVQLHVRLVQYDTLVEDYLEGLAGDNPPDILIIDNNKIGAFRAIQGLENLLESPYEGERFRSLIPEQMWGFYSSLNEKRMIAMPIQILGAVTYYRADILAAHGFPAEPAELAYYLESPENWLHMAKVLKEHDIYIFQYATDPLEVTGMQYSLLDQFYRFGRNNETVRKAAELGREIRKYGLSMQHDVYHAATQEAMQQDRFAMFYMGAWATPELQGWAPGTKGKWRMTRLPMNLYGVDGGSSIAITSSSRNKDLAWDFVKSATLLNEVIHAPAEREFLGGQDLTYYYSSQLQRMEKAAPSPFDEKLARYWSSGIASVIERSDNIGDNLNALEKEMMDSITEDRRRLIHFLNIKPD